MKITRAIVIVVCFVCCVSMRTRKALGSTRTKKPFGSSIQADDKATSSRDPLVGKEELQRWQEWKERRNWRVRLLSWFAWGVCRRGPQREAMEDEFNSVFHRLLPGNPILKAPEALICERTAFKRRDQFPNNLALRTIGLSCTFPVNVFHLSRVWPAWKRKFGLNTRYNDTRDWMIETAASWRERLSTYNDTESEYNESDDEYNGAESEYNESDDETDDEDISEEYVSHLQEARQVMKLVITDSRSYPYRLGNRTGLLWGYDDPYVVCVGGRLQKSIDDPYLPPDALPKRCTGFLGYKEINNMMDSLIKSLKPGIIQSLTARKDDIKYMAQWLVLSGFNGKDDDLDTQDIMNMIIRQANEVGLSNLLSRNWQTLYIVGKLFASSWLDRLEGREVFLPVQGLLDLGMVDEHTLASLLLPLGSYSDAEGKDTEGERQWERMSERRRKMIIQALEAEHDRLHKTAASVFKAVVQLKETHANNRDTAMKLNELARDECKKFPARHYIECIKLVATNKNPEAFDTLIKNLAKNAVAVPGAEIVLSKLLSEGARIVDESMFVQFDPVTLYEYNKVVNTAPAFEAISHARHKATSAGNFFCPGFTQRAQDKVQALADRVEKMPHEFHQHVQASKDLMPGNGTLEVNFDLTAKEHFGGLAEYISSGNPDHLHAAFEATGNLNLHEDGIVTNADSMAQAINGALQRTAEQHELLARFINGAQREAAHHALQQVPNGTLADASKLLMDGKVEGFAHTSELAQKLTWFWPDTVRRNMALVSEEGIKQHLQKSIDQINWLDKNQEVTDAIHQLNSMIKVAHPHVDAHIKYDVVASAEVVNGKLVFHEVVKLHPDVAVHSGFLADLSHINPMTFIIASTPLVHLFWIVVRVGLFAANMNWHAQMSDITKKWNGIFHGKGNIPTACVCQGGHAWPRKALARNPDRTNRRKHRKLPGEGVPKMSDSTRLGEEYECSKICDAVDHAPDGRDTTIDGHLNKLGPDPEWSEEKRETEVDWF